MPMPRCKLCGLRIEGKALDIPSDAHDAQTLPPACLRIAQQAGAKLGGAKRAQWEASTSLHNEKGKWCLLQRRDQGARRAQ